MFMFLEFVHWRCVYSNHVCHLVTILLSRCYVLEVSNIPMDLPLHGDLCFISVP